MKTMHRVSRLGQMGDGIVEAGDGVLHFPKVLPGEQVEIAAGRVSRIVDPSPERVAAFCQHYEACGGCKFQHWAETPYRAWKKARLAQALRAQGLDVSIADMRDAHGAGRRRVSLHVRQIGDVWRAGFMEQKTHDLVPLNSCPVLVPQLQDAPTLAAEFGPHLGACDVAMTWATNGLDVAIKAERKAVAKRLPALSALFNSRKLLRLSINGEIFAMAAPPMVQLGAAMVVLPVQSFLQATLAGEETLYELVLASRPKKVRNVADLFSGLGTFALRLAQHLPVTAIDSDKPAIEALQKTVRVTQALKPVTAMVRNLFNAPLTVGELKDLDWIVLDPPRSGAEAQIRQLAKSAVRHVTYVSCDVQSFTRDARILVDGGFKFNSVTPVDQFKWTGHVELVGVFSK